MKKILILILSVIYISGCNVLSSFDTFEPVEGKIVSDNKEYTMIIGDFEWVEEDFEANKKSNLDKKGLADEFDTLELEKGTKLKIEIDGSPLSLKINEESEDGSVKSIDIRESEITLPTNEGYYIYEVNAKWNEGNISYVFDVNIK
ncbi:MULTISPECIES: hypothetical protein [Bacillales]|uniref:DUF3221 domain-containing protein n=1 Tax=Lysinibacillus halotolerans TaxID=1368476 RepID=A0A3M8GYT1_9BACI|nr:hypothetical protein [Lysinibacillus halotolerans]RNC95402.1 hypothetical protein EC501_18055 [Lysinibacillus halotolerans]